MAVARSIPTCPYCKKPIATARHKDESDVPRFMRLIGDTFINWEYKQCNCKGAKKERTDRKEYMKKHPLSWDEILKNPRFKNHNQ